MWGASSSGILSLFLSITYLSSIPMFVSHCFFLKARLGCNIASRLLTSTRKLLLLLDFVGIIYIYKWWDMDAIQSRWIGRCAMENKSIYNRIEAHLLFVYGSVIAGYISIVGCSAMRATNTFLTAPKIRNLMNNIVVLLCYVSTSVCNNCMLCAKHPFI